MIPPRIPPEEETRIVALRALQILDTPPEDRFDRITRMAQRLFNVPITLISLVDSDRVWFKSRLGLDAAQSPRETSFCGHAILGKETLVVPDAQKDDRFRDNPFVTDEPRVRFYAGRPLASRDGSRVGTLCLIDRNPRTMTPQDLVLLDDLGRMIEAELEVGMVSRAYVELRERGAQLHDFLRNANDLIQSITPEGRFVFANRMWRETLGYSQEEIPGLMVLQIVRPDKWEEFGAVMRKVLEGKPASNFETVFRSKHGREIAVSGNIVPSSLEGKETLINGIFRDVTEQKFMQEELKRLAVTDGLTGLYNARHLRELLQHESARAERNESSLSVAMMDLDHFKKINDSHGHPAGDAALSRVARILRNRMRKTDIIGRYGGDELCLILPETPGETARDLLEKIRQTIESEAVECPFAAPFRVTCSVGVAERSGDEAEPDTLIRLADLALYQAKNGGRNRVVLYTPDPEPAPKER